MIAVYYHSRLVILGDTVSLLSKLALEILPWTFEAGITGEPPCPHVTETGPYIHGASALTAKPCPQLKMP